MHLFATTTAEQVLELGKVAAIVEVDKPPARHPAGAVATNVSRSP
jgi:hypothetical protein